MDRSAYGFFLARLAAAVLTLGLFGVGPARAAAPSPFDGVTDYVRGLAREGNTAELTALVHELEATAVPESAGRAEMIAAVRAGLGGVARGALVKRLDALPAGVRATQPARPAAPFRFPRDHGVHGTALLEWWYFNGHLKVGGRRMAYMVTFFKTLPRLHFAHLALTDLDSGAHSFRRSFMRPFQVKANAEGMNVTFGGDSVREVGAGAYRLEFTLDGRAVTLDLAQAREAMPINGDGVIDMPEGTTSRYYSLSRLSTTGTMVGKDGSREAITGQSWFDHQWGNFVAVMRPWDWFCFQLSDGSDYNIFHFREVLGFAGRTCVTRFDARGRLAFTQDVGLERGAWWTSPRSGHRFVTLWQVQLRGLGEGATVRAMTDDQEMPRTGWHDFPPAYWEGAMNVSVKKPDGTVVSGVGFCEHFPYR